MNLAEQIRTKRRSEGLSAAELAEMLGVQMDNIYKWEKGTKPSNAEHLLKLNAWLSGNLEIVPNQNAVPTPMQILDRLSRAFMEQAEGFRTQTEILRSIESKMARADAQGIAQISLTALQRDVTKLVERQELAIEEFRESFAGLPQRIPVSKDVHKTKDQNGGNG